MPTGSKGIGKGVMSEEFDIHSAFSWEKFIREGVDAHFNLRSETDNVTTLRKASEFWIQADWGPARAGYIRCPASIDGVAIYSKRAYRYPIVSAYTSIPVLAGAQYLWIGMENGYGGGNGIVGFNFGLGYARAYMGSFGLFEFVDILGLLPADYQTVQHNYVIRLGNNMAEFYVDRSPVACMLNTVNSRGSLPQISGPPYAIWYYSGTVARSLECFIEPANLKVALDVPLAPWGFRMSDGEAIYPEVFRLYDAGTNNLFAGLVIAAGSETSHPVPIFGFGNKTLHFQATQAGTLNIEILTLTGNWRTYDSINISANTLLSYVMVGEAVLFRVTFTPTSYPATISEAEIAMK